MNYVTTPRIVESQVIEGVRFTLLRMNVRRRAAFRSDIASHLADLRELREEREALATEQKSQGDAFPAEKRDRLMHVAAEELRLDQEHTASALIRHFCVGIEGLEIDGAPATVESLLAEGPAELCDEISGEIDRSMGLTATERKNSQSPSTSHPAVDGGMSDTTAEAAAKQDMILPTAETASSISPAT